MMLAAGLAVAFWSVSVGTPHAQAPVPEAPEAEAPEAAPRGGLAEGADRLGEGLRLLMRGLQEESAPILRQLLDEAGPALGAAQAGVGRMLEGFEAIGVGLADLAGFDAPVLLPNGDILIRRRPPADAVPPSSPQPKEDDEPGPVEL